MTLKRRGANYVACCPFHNEKTPSFYVSPSKGIYKCFGCGKAGSAVGFVMEHEHCSYVEALRWLADKYHIEIVEKEESADEIAQRQRRESLLLVSEFAQKFYASQLQTPEGRSVGDVPSALPISASEASKTLPSPVSGWDGLRRARPRWWMPPLLRATKWNIFWPQGWPCSTKTAA